VEVKVNGAKADVERLVDAVRSEHSPFDFNKIVPRPAAYDESEKSTRQFEGLAVLGPADRYAIHFRGALQHLAQYDQAFAETVDGAPISRERAQALMRESQDPYVKECLKQGELAMRLEAEHGYTDWYDWSCANWGTKWNNAGDVMVDETPEVVNGKPGLTVQYCFDTAWDWPQPVLERLVEMFPELAVSVQADEESGEFWIDAFSVDGTLEVCENEGYREGGLYDHEDD
jgi:hypothetical protein